MEVEDVPITIDGVIVKDHFLGMCWLSIPSETMPSLPGGPDCMLCHEPQQSDDCNAFALSNLRFFFFLNLQRQSCQTGCLIIWFKNQTKLLSPVFIFLTDFETRPLQLHYKLPEKKKKKVVFQFHVFPKAWLPFGILNLLIEFSLKQSGLLRL